MSNPTRGPETPGWRRGRGVGGPRHDSYRATEKPREPTVCPTCGAVFHKGRWTWAERPDGAHEHVCPACQRIHERNPAGRLHILGELGAREQEILSLIRHQEEAEKRDHPLERLMAVEKDAQGVMVTTTGIHLARRIGEALQRTWHGRAKFQYLKEQDLVRVTFEA